MPSTTETPVFTQYKAFEKLQKLAASPLDLTKTGVLNPERVRCMVAESAGYKMLYATERVTPEVVEALQELADEAGALSWMQRMQNGEVINYIDGYDSERRQVLHTAIRDFYDNPNTSPAAQEATAKEKKELERVKAFIDKIDIEKSFTDIIFIAIGGSELGPKANYLALEHLLKPGRHVHFIGNIDPDEAARVLDALDLKKSLVVVVSKTGSTLETNTNEALVRDRFEQAGLRPDKHFVVVTGEGSPIDKPGRYLERFHLWDWIGGRFSASSAIGGLLFSFALGYPIFEEFLRGAHAMDQAALSSDLQENLPLLGALIGIWNRNFLDIQTLAVVPYSSALWRYAAHIQQVDMESNGKRVDRQGRAVTFDTGPIVWGEPGNNAQHSFYQLIHQGSNPVALEMIGFRDSQYGQDLEVHGTTSQEKLLANLLAQSIALATGQPNENPNKTFPGNRPSHILLAEKLTPHTLGALFSYYEMKVAFQGFIWNINSFDQEGVMLGKVLANRVIERFVERRHPNTGAKSFPLGDAYLYHLEQF